ncbi:hypothetical protein AFLA_007193 [Aspergillus flavus NRRL3357]|nr:hypothetical protein AFLA_007193 [Aspergillus flavus NRRL3357]
MGMVLYRNYHSNLWDARLSATWTDADHPITDLDNQNPDDDQSDSTEWISAKGSRQFRLVLGIQPSEFLGRLTNDHI